MLKSEMEKGSRHLLKELPSCQVVHLLLFINSSFDLIHFVNPA